MKKQTTQVLLFLVCIWIFQSCAWRPCTTITAHVAGQHSRLPGESDSWRGACGVQAGLTFNVLERFTAPVIPRAGVNISMQGARWEDDWGEGLVEGIVRMTYLNFPLMARYRLDNGIYGEAGIQPGFLLAAKDKYNGGSFNYREWMKPFDMSIPLNIGYEINSNLSAGLNVAVGLTNVNKGGDYINKDRNLVIGGQVRWTFPALAN